MSGNNVGGCCELKLMISIIVINRTTMLMNNSHLFTIDTYHDHNRDHTQINALKVIFSVDFVSWGSSNVMSGKKIKAEYDEYHLKTRGVGVSIFDPLSTFIPSHRHCHPHTHLY